MALIDVYHAAIADSDIKQRAIGAALTAQAGIRGESGATPNHANRLIWADALVADPQVEGDKLWVQMLQNSTVINAIVTGTSVTDAQIQTVVDATIDSVATG